MIENTQHLQTLQTKPQTQRVLTYVKNERMGGFVPKYEMVEKTQTTARPEKIQIAGTQGEDLLNFQSASMAKSTNQGSDSFGFADLVDMVNPMHHVPIVGHIYRELTGDEIKPIGKIMGGAAFGGPLGAATGLIDTIITHETGQDMASNAYQMAFNAPTSRQYDGTHSNQPEIAIENAIKGAQQDADMTATLLTFSDLGAKDEKTLKIEAYKRAEDTMNAAPPREAITQVTFPKQSGLYGL